MAKVPDNPTTWNVKELASLTAAYPDIKGTLDDAVSKYNPTPGTLLK